MFQPFFKPITLMGANASGKTEVALALAARVNGEIISADSKQIYKYLSAGTAKPAGAWTETEGQSVYLVSGVPYHLVDIIDPRSSYDAASFVRSARQKINEIKARGKTPIIAGGTGMYIQALWNGLDPLPAADPALRAELAAKAERDGKEALHSVLKELDPKAASIIPPGNIQRVMRAIEITKLAGRPVSEIWSGRFFNALPAHLGTFIFFHWKKELLNERIKQRAITRFDEWLQETKNLLERGYPEDAPGLKSLGYPQVLDFHSGRLTRAEAIHSITMLSMSYAKRQNTWFSRYKNARRLDLESFSDYKPEEIADDIVNRLKAEG
ncbi:MAG: tRNA (adenosine(37)-N6)-dimethylallyltransferase MiaA [Elusimicrobia bacterium]|nr:tRNA (adenosine(37)-N6)-dimethylallyltransferase MiaA [Elusimicrobiota bacterium]